MDIQNAINSNRFIAVDNVPLAVRQFPDRFLNSDVVRAGLFLAVFVEVGDGLRRYSLYCHILPAGCRVIGAHGCRVCAVVAENRKTVCNGQGALDSLACGAACDNFTAVDRYAILGINATIITACDNFTAVDRYTLRINAAIITACGHFAAVDNYRVAAIIDSCVYLVRVGEWPCRLDIAAVDRYCAIRLIFIVADTVFFLAVCCDQFAHVLACALGIDCEAAVVIATDASVNGQLCTVAENEIHVAGDIQTTSNRYIAVDNVPIAVRQFPDRFLNSDVVRAGLFRAGCVEVGDGLRRYRLYCHILPAGFRVIGALGCRVCAVVAENRKTVCNGQGAMDSRKSGAACDNFTAVDR